MRVPVSVPEWPCLPRTDIVHIAGRGSRKIDAITRFPSTVYGRGPLGPVAGRGLGRVGPGAVPAYRAGHQNRLASADLAVHTTVLVVGLDLDPGSEGPERSIDCCA
jgi:hypothetical protein